MTTRLLAGHSMNGSTSFPPRQECGVGNSAGLMPWWGLPRTHSTANPVRGVVSGPVVTVMVEASTAAETKGEAGVAISGGPRVGPDMLDRILCEGSVEVMVDQGSGRSPVVSATTGVIPPKIRRFVLLRDRGCTIDGCGSRYRLQLHHIVPRSQGGTHDVENLATLCWWHHHVAIHGRGYRIDPTSPPQRRRIIPEEHDPTKNPPYPGALTRGPEAEHVSGG